MSGFKLIAIRPSGVCNRKFLKVLNPDEIYKLLSNYDFSFRDDDEKGNVESILCTDSKTENLYDINKKDKKLEVNISAIVGKNGSGKSSIVELLYMAMFNVACDLQILPKINDDGEKIEFDPGIAVEIFYSLNKKYFNLHVDGNIIGIRSYIINPKGKFPEEYSSIKKEDLSDLFYSIVINYSHYSLNSLNVGNWVKNIFHKNDGYQTPIVLNPYRKNGNIDINTEEYLTRSRLISNILRVSKSGYQKQLLPNKIAQQIKFTLNSKKAVFDAPYQKYEKFLLKNKENIIRETFKTFLHKRPNIDFASNDKNLTIAHKYILKKLITILRKYKPYQNTRFNFVEKVPKKEAKKEEYVFSLDKLTAYLQELQKDESHITFKLRQAMNFLINYTTYSDKIGKFINIDDIANDLNNLKKATELINIIPPSFFDFDIKFDKSSSFNMLSSGEKQKIFSSATLIYHLVNISSVRKSARYVKYRNVNIIFDEIELYYHPDLQRTFIKDTLESLKNVELKNIDCINFILITHSPFILSDIPNSNILFLNEYGKSDNFASSIKTFGANIHDLLKHSFFLEEGSMGEFAKDKINETIAFLKYNKLTVEISTIDPKNLNIIKLKQEELAELRTQFNNDSKDFHKSLIDVIAEPLLQIKLSEMYDEAFNEKYQISVVSKRILELEELRKKLTV